MTSTITIHIIDQPGGGVMVYTTGGAPIPGQRLTPGQALATDLLNQCTHRASDVRYWHGRDKALELVRELIDPDQFGYACSGEVRRAACRVLGLPVTPTEPIHAQPAVPDEAPMYRAKRTPLITGNKSVLVYGPQGSGKSLHADELRQHFGLAAVLDDWLPGRPWPIKDHLVLSHEPAPADMRRAIPIQTALAMLRNNAPGYPF